MRTQSYSIENQVWCVNTGEYMGFGRITIVWPMVCPLAIATTHHGGGGGASVPVSEQQHKGNRQAGGDRPTHNCAGSRRQEGGAVHTGAQGMARPA